MPSETGQGTAIAWPSAIMDTVSPPSSAGATLSGWPSSTVASVSICCWERGEPCAALAAKMPAAIRLALLPSPRDTGISDAMRKNKPACGRFMTFSALK